MVFAYNRTVEVNRLWANRWGLVSMHGNVSEWCQDAWNDSYAEPGRPDDGSPWLSGETTMRISRGGTWASHPNNSRSYDRDFAKTDNRDNLIGFRVARTL